MNYYWRAGARPPKGVSADTVKSAIDALPDISPENLVRASKAKRHCLHSEFWSEGEDVWAHRGRKEASL